MTSLQRLAKRLSYERVPETCPQVHTAGVKAVAKFHHAVATSTRWYARMNRFERHQLENMVGELVADLLDGAKTHGTLPLREAFVREIEDRLQTHMTPERIARIEQGEDPEAPLPASASIPARL